MNSHSIDHANVQAFFVALGKDCLPNTEMILLGGVALNLLGSQRATQDLDYVGNDLPKEYSPFQHQAHHLAAQHGIELEAVPIEAFLPISAQAHERRRLIGQFGNLKVSILDPYTIALSKLDRGFESDLQDVAFLLGQTLIEAETLKKMLDEIAPNAARFDLEIGMMRRRLIALLS